MIVTEKLKKLISVFVVLIVVISSGAIALAGDTLSDVKKKGVLVVGCKDSLPPFGYIDERTRQIVGYDIDFVNAIAKKMGVRVELKPVTSASRMPLLMEGHIDIIAATMTKNPERAKVIDFSHAYLLTGQKFITKKGSVKSLKDLEGKRIGTAKGSTSEKNVAAAIPSATVLSFDDYPQAFLALAQGKVSAVTTDEAILAGILAKAANKAQYEIPNVQITDEPYGLGMRKGDTNFVNFVNKTLLELEKSGEARSIFNKWFGPQTQFMLSRTFTINPGDKIQYAKQGYDYLSKSSGDYQIYASTNSSPSAPPSLSAILSFTEPSGNNVLDAEETGNLVITIKNSGKGDASDVTANLSLSKQVKGLSYDRHVSIGSIPAGKTIKKEIEVSASEDISSEMLTFNVEIKEANGFEPHPMKISLQTQELTPPKLVVADVGINDQNGGSKVEPGKIVETTVRVQNVGHGEARNVFAEIKKGQNVFLAGDSKSRFELGSLSSGNFKDLKFSFYTNNRISNGEAIPISIEIIEARPRFSSNNKLSLVMNAPQKSAQEFIVKATEQQEKTNIQLAGGLSVDVDSNIPEGQKAGEYDIAVVIGNKSYSQSGSPDVDFAVNDAQMMKEYLQRTMGFLLENIIYEENAGLSKFNEIFGTERNHKGKLFKHVKAGASRVFVYYVGHGAPDLETQDAYLVPVDANPQYLRDNGYRLQTFYDNLAKIPATRLTVVLDSCFSGNSEKGMLFKGMSPALVKVKKELRGPEKATVITSAGTDQISVWYPEKRHSLFTYYFLKGISGDADYNKDGKIDVGEMKRYLADKVPYMANRLKGYDQQPAVSGDSTDVLAVLKK